MKSLTSKRLIMAGSVFLLLVGSVFFALHFSQKGDNTNLLRNESNQLADNLAPTFRSMQSSEEQLINAANKNLPTFKSTSQTKVDETANLKVDFSANKDLEVTEPSKKVITHVTNYLDINNNDASNNYAQQMEIETYKVSQHSFSAKPISFQTKHSNDGGVQFANISYNTSLSISNTSSTRFLANNSLSLTTDLSGNNSPKMINGETNPGDPGIPVGDGLWVLMALLVGYGMVLCCVKSKVAY
jgi:hypothetical protein